MSENESAPIDSAPPSETVEQSGAAEPTMESSGQDAATSGIAEEGAQEPEAEAPVIPPEEITYHAVEKDGQVTAIWEMQGRKHVRTIDPRSRQGQDILRLYTADHHDETPAPESSEAAST